MRVPSLRSIHEMVVAANDAYLGRDIDRVARDAILARADRLLTQIGKTWDDLAQLDNPGATA